MQVNGTVGIIGLGLMGTALSERLIGAKVPVIGFDVEPAKCEKLQAFGGLVATSVHELADGPRIRRVFASHGQQGRQDAGAGFPAAIASFSNSERC